MKLVHAGEVGEVRKAPHRVVVRGVAEREGIVRRVNRLVADVEIEGVVEERRAESGPEGAAGHVVVAALSRLVVRVGVLDEESGLKLAVLPGVVEVNGEVRRRLGAVGRGAVSHESHGHGPVVGSEHVLGGGAPVHSGLVYAAENAVVRVVRAVVGSPEVSDLEVAALESPAEINTVGVGVVVGVAHVDVGDSGRVVAVAVRVRKGGVEDLPVHVAEEVGGAVDSDAVVRYVGGAVHVRVGLAGEEDGIHVHLAEGADRQLYAGGFVLYPEVVEGHGGEEGHGVPGHRGERVVSLAREHVRHVGLLDAVKGVDDGIAHRGVGGELDAGVNVIADLGVDSDLGDGRNAGAVGQGSAGPVVHCRENRGSEHGIEVSADYGACVGLGVKSLGDYHVVAGVGPAIAVEHVGFAAAGEALSREYGVQLAVEGDSLKLGDSLVEVRHGVLEVADPHAEGVKLRLELVHESSELLEISLGRKSRMLLVVLCKESGNDHGHLVTSGGPVTLESAVRIALDEAAGGKVGHRVARPMLFRNIGEHGGCECGGREAEHCGRRKKN